MAFTNPPTWAHADPDTNLDDKLNIYSSNLTHFASAHPGLMSQMSTGGSEFGWGESRTSYVIRRVHRWLVYLVDDADDAPTITLLREAEGGDYSETMDYDQDSTDPKYLDLEDLGWCPPGATYCVRNVLYAFEASLEEFDA